MSGLLTVFGPEPKGADRSSLITCAGHGSIGRIALLAALLSAATLPVEAGALEWLNSATSRNKKSQPAPVARSVEPGSSMNNGFEEQKIVGNDLVSYKFAQTHWMSSKDRMEKACRAISSRYNDPAVRDILQKLFVIDTQLFRENIKNSALAVNEIAAANQSIKQGLVGLTRIVTAPGQETLDALEKNVDQVNAANVSQTLLVKKYLAGAEKTIQMAQAAYETLELIPSLSLPGLDLLVQMSKQLMRTTQSNSEAFKGLLLNVQTSSEQVGSGLENIKKTVRETLRFSDHFAIKQFPLINLPAPTREQIFVQLNSLGNSVRGVDNTLSIGDSQARNTAQQFTHLVSGFIAKAAESLKYQSPGGEEKPLEQISTYARNQVSGLFLRVKEDITQMRQDMARAARPSVGNMPPAVKFESRDEFAARKAMSSTSQQLPLFLLGAGVKMPSETARDNAEMAQENLRIPEPSIKIEGDVEVSALMPRETGKTQVLYKEKSAPTGNDLDLMQSEVNILNQELGSDFFFGGEGENLSKSSIQARGGADMPSYGQDEESDDELTVPDDDQQSPEMRMSYSNLEDSGEPEIELLKLDSSTSGADQDDLIPMMRFDSDTLNFEE